jgi:hypothetical protein
MEREELRDHPRPSPAIAGQRVDFGYDQLVTPDEAVRALSEVAAQAGIEVRIERFELAIAGKGGLCRIEGRLVVLVDAKLGILEQAGVIGEALAEVDLGGIEVPREVAAYLGTGHGEVKPLTRPRPLVRVR